MVVIQAVRRPFRQGLSPPPPRRRPWQGGGV